MTQSRRPLSMIVTSGLLLVVVVVMITIIGGFLLAIVSVSAAIAVAVGSTFLFVSAYRRQTERLLDELRRYPASEELAAQAREALSGLPIDEVVRAVEPLLPEQNQGEDYETALRNTSRPSDLRVAAVVENIRRLRPPQP